MPRCRSCARSGRTAWLDARPTRQDRPVRRHARTRAQRRLAALAPGAANDVCAAWPGCWSSHRCRGHNRAAPVLHLPAALVEIDDAASLAGEVRITREDPGAMAPGA